LLTISATTPYVARIPIRWSDFARVSTTPSARVTLIGFSRLVEGKVVSIEHEVLMRANQRVVMATALLDTPPTDLLPGASARCRIECSPMTALEYAQFIMHSISTSVDGVAN
jgi:hypothetical protein